MKTDGSNIRFHHSVRTMHLNSLCHHVLHAEREWKVRSSNSSILKTVGSSIHFIITYACWTSIIWNTLLFFAVRADEELIHILISLSPLNLWTSHLKSSFLLSNVGQPARLSTVLLALGDEKSWISREPRFQKWVRKRKICFVEGLLQRMLSQCSEEGEDKPVGSHTIGNSSLWNLVFFFLCTFTGVQLWATGKALRSFLVSVRWLSSPPTGQGCLFS